MPEILDQAATLRAAAALRNGADRAEANGGNMQEPEEPAGQQSPPATTGSGARRFDFRTPQRQNKSQLKSLKLLHENFCGPLGKALGALSGLPCPVKLESLTPEKLAKSPARVYACASAAGGTFLIAFSRPVAWLLLERLLGGAGSAAAAQDRPHSEIEKNILSNLLAAPVLARYAETWAKIVPAQFTQGPFVDDIYSVPGMTADTETVAVTFSFSLGSVDGELAVILPFSFLKPLMPELDMAKILNSGVDGGRSAAEDKTLLAIPVGLRVFFSSIEIKVKDLNSLAKGDVLRLDTRPEDEVTVVVEGQPRFAARTGKVGNGLGVQITRALERKNTKDGDKNANSK